MTAARILVADDKEEILDVCRTILEGAGHEVTTAADGVEALQLLKARRCDLFFVDLKMPGRSGLEVLSLALAVDPSLAIIMLTGFPSVETAVEAVKRGAFDYLTKPFTADQLSGAADRALKHRQLATEHANLRQQPAAYQGFDRILGASEVMQKVFGTLQKVMDSDANILLLGETGTGKELIAGAIHAHSGRRENPFVPVDCAALPENLLESELFGHEKGAFTGADKARRGLLELAHTGTVFFDEIGEFAAALQGKLLRALQERELRRLGGEKTIPVDIRVIAATNRDLRAEVANRSFREDLYYRLNVVSVYLPPLRNRKADIPLLANHFLKRFSHQHQRAIDSLSPEVMKVFLTYPWPGNVRELQNAVQHAVLLTDSRSVEPCDLPDYLQTGFSQALSFQSMRAKEAEGVQKPFLAELLRKHAGNVSDAAAEAGVSRKMIYRLAKKLGTDLEQFRRC